MPTAIDGSAVFRMVESSVCMNIAVATTQGKPLWTAGVAVQTQPARSAAGWLSGALSVWSLFFMGQAITQQRSINFFESILISFSNC